MPSDHLAQWAARIDHVVVTTGDVKGTLAVFTDFLGLAEAWPCTTWLQIDEGAAAGGGCNIGVGHADGARPQLVAIAIDPCVDPDKARAEVSARGFHPSALVDSGALSVPDEDAYRPWNAGWIDMTVDDWDSVPAPFTCSYRHDRVARRAREAEQFRTHGGGPLGFLGVSAIVVHDPDPDALRTRWLRLLDPAPTVDGEAILLGDGPRLEMRAGEPGAALVSATLSLDLARATLADRGVDAHAIGGSAPEFRIDPAATLGLDVRVR